MRILLAGDGSGNSDIGGGEFCICITFRFGGDSEIMTGGIGRFVETVVAAMMHETSRRDPHETLRGSLLSFWCGTALN